MVLRSQLSRGGHAWVAAPAVQLLVQVGTQSLHRHALRLANRFRAGIGLEPGNSEIVSLAADGDAADAMAAARVTGSARAGRCPPARPNAAIGSVWPSVITDRRPLQAA